MHVRQFVAHVIWCVDNYDAAGDFDLQGAVERPAASILRRAKGSQKDKWKERVNTFHVAVRHQRGGSDSGQRPGPAHAGRLRITGRTLTSRDRGLRTGKAAIFDSGVFGPPTGLESNGRGQRY
jgi:hypothetical protein